MKVLLFNAPPRSGKNTAVDIVTKELKYAGYGVVNLSLARPLKAAIHNMFALTELEVAGIDKDEQQQRFNGLSLRQLYIYLSEECMKPKFGHDFWAKTLSHELYKLSTNSFDDNSKLVVTVDDLGFDAEIKHLSSFSKAMDFSIVHVVRYGHTFDNDSRNWVYPPDNSVTISKISNHGDIEEFKANLMAYLKQSKLL